MPSLDFPDLRYILDILLAYKDRSTVDEHLGKQLLALDPNETTYHIKTITVEGKSPLYEVWRIEEWKTDFRRRLEIEKLSEKERRKQNIRAEGISAIMKGVIKMTGLDENSAKEFAKTIY